MALGSIVSIAKNTTSEAHQRLAAEVLELGASLFEIALEAGTSWSSTGAETADTTETAEEAYPIEELRAAVSEFFTALRLLLGIDGEG